MDEKQTTESAEVPKIPTTTPPPSKEAAPSPQTPVTGAPPTTTAETDTEDKDPLPAFDEWTQKMLAEKNKEVKNGRLNTSSMRAALIISLIMISLI